MTAVPKKIVVDEHGAPVEVILPWATFCDIAELLGLDLDAEAETDLRGTRRDLATDSCIPESFKHSIEEASAGKFVEMDIVLRGEAPPK